MKERPLLFSAPMVKAILNGTKTQTRRVVKHPENMGCLTGDCPHELQQDCDDSILEWAGDECPHGQIGDRIWVKETFAPRQLASVVTSYIYRADGTANLGPWKPSIFMPRIASRITLEIVGVSVERLQDISEEDAKAEGVENICPFYNCNGSGIIDVQDNHCQCADYNPKDVYEWLWESIHGNGSWKKNPWVWKIEFKHLTK